MLCSKCKIEKESIYFSPGSSWCKECRNLLMAKRKEKKKELKVKYLNPKKSRPLEKDKLMLSEDWEKLVKVVDKKEALLLLDLIQNCGLRVHEALFLTPADFDFTKGLIQVKTLKQKNQQGVIHTLCVRPDILSILQRLNFGPATCYFNFKYNNLLKYFKRWLKVAGINPRLGIHSLRHLYSSRFRPAGIKDIDDQRRLLRHAAPGVTELYLHHSSLDLKELAEKTWLRQPWLWKELD